LGIAGLLLQVVSARMVESPKTFFNGLPEHVISMPIKNEKHYLCQAKIAAKYQQSPLP
jgi:hypothetical protein